MMPPSAKRPGSVRVPHSECLARPMASGAEPGTSAAFTRQPTSAIPAEIIKLVLKPPSARAPPPTSEPREMPQNSALLFQARAAPRRFGKSWARPACCAGKKSWATAELTPSAGSISLPVSKATRSNIKQVQRPMKLAPAIDLAPSRSAKRPPMTTPASAPQPPVASHFSTSKMRQGCSTLCVHRDCGNAIDASHAPRRRC